MLTKTDLTDALKPILKTLNALQAEQTITSLELKTTRAELGQLDKKLGQFDKKVDKGFDQIDRRLDEQAATMAGFFHETWAALDKLERKTEERINKIETNIGLPQS